MKEPENCENQSPQFLPEIRRGIYATLTIYEVEESELEVIIQGPDTLYLNFAIFLLSTAISLFVALLTTIVPPKVFTVFVIFTILGSLLGIIFFILWCVKRKSSKAMIQKIKKRLPPQGNTES